jgi:Rod binding domain-containing protein
MSVNGLAGQSGAVPAYTGAMKKTFNDVPENATSRQKEDLGKLKKLSVDYESFFMKEVISAMRKTVPTGGATSGGNAEEIFKSMQDDQLAGNMAKQGNSGIAQELYNKLSKTYLATPVKIIGATK